MEKEDKKMSVADGQKKKKKEKKKMIGKGVT